MPLEKYFNGHGPAIMAEMVKRYGKKKGESVFYAVANSRNEAPEKTHKKRSKERYERA